SLKLLQKLFLLDLHYHNIRPDFPNAAERNHILAVRSKEPAYLSGTRDNHRFHFTAADVDLHIHDTSELPADADIDHFLVSKLTESHAALLLFLYIIAACCYTIICNPPQKDSPLFSSIITGFKSDENRSICRPYSAGRETVFSFRSGQ